MIVDWPTFSVCSAFGPKTLPRPTDRHVVSGPRDSRSSVIEWETGRESCSVSPSVRPSVRPSVHSPVRRSVKWSLRQTTCGWQRRRWQLTCRKKVPLRDRRVRRLRRVIYCPTRLLFCSHLTANSSKGRAHSRFKSKSNRRAGTPRLCHSFARFAKVAETEIAFGPSSRAGAGGRPSFWRFGFLLRSLAVPPRQ